MDDEEFNLMALHNILETVGLEDHADICIEAYNG